MCKLSMIDCSEWLLLRGPLTILNQVNGSRKSSEITGKINITNQESYCYKLAMILESYCVRL